MRIRIAAGFSTSVFIALFAMAMLPRDADAITVRTWVGNSDNWVFSDPTNWNGNTPIANGDLLVFNGIHEDTLRNDIPGLSLTRLTFVDGFFTITGDPIQVDDIVVDENGGYSTVTANLSGFGRTLVGKGSYLGLSGANTFTGQVDVAGGLVASSDKALGSTAGATRILPGGHVEFAGRDLGLEPILIETGPGALTDRGCAILNIDGASILRNVKTSGTSCIVNNAAISYPNGIQELSGTYEIYLLSGTHIFAGNTSATGMLHIGGEGTLIWDATSLVSISNAGLGDAGAEGTVAGTGTAAGIDINEGTFAPGEDSMPAVFTIAGPLKLQNGAFEVLLKGTAAGTGHSQAKVSGPITIGAKTTLDVTLGFSPAPGQSFRIIDNTGSQAVSGTFTGLPEGASFALGGKTWAITYKGGTGNDVVISTTTPGPPTPPPPSDPRPFKQVMPMVAKNP